MFRRRADHPHNAFAAHNLAVFTNSSNAGSHLHDITFIIRAPGDLPTGELAYVAENPALRKNAEAQNSLEKPWRPAHFSEHGSKSEPVLRPHAH
jgi:hypothetical protein